MQSERHVRRLTAETSRALSGPQPLLNHTLVTWQRARYSNTSRNSNNVLAQHCPQAEHRNHRVNALIVIAILHLPLIAQWPTNCVRNGRRMAHIKPRRRALSVASSYPDFHRRLLVLNHRFLQLSKTISTIADSRLRPRCGGAAPRCVSLTIGIGVNSYWAQGLKPPPPLF